MGEMICNKEYLWKDSKISSIKRLLKEIEKSINRYYYCDDTLLSNMFYEDLITIISEAEHIAQITRVCLNRLEGPELVQYDRQYADEDNCTYIVEPIEDALSNIKKKQDCKPIPLQEEVKYYDGVFEFYTPLTFKRGFKMNNFLSNYLIAYQLEDAIKKWAYDNNFSLINSIEPPYFLVMKRVVSKYVNNRNYDADNYENQRIINKISDAFGLNDGPKNMSLVSTFEENPYKKEGMYFYLISAKDINKLTSLIPYAPTNLDSNLSTFDKLFTKVKKVYKKLFNSRLNNKNV